MSVPILRFPNFKDKWNLEKIGNITDKVNSGKTPLGGEKAYIDQGVLFIRSQNVNDNKLNLDKIVFVSEETNSTMKNSIVKANDILLNITGASLGRSCVVPNDFEIGNVNQHVCIVRLKQNYNPRFVQPILSSDKGQNIFNSLQVGGGREGLNFESIKSIELNFPTFEEQTKIASFLTAVDDKLQALKKKKELLEQYKKGVMQQLFSQELRFKNDDGTNYPDWEEKKLGEVCDVKKGKQLNKEELTETGDYPCINGGINPSGYTNKYNTKENTITISEGGNSCGYVNFFNVKFWSGGHNYSIEICNPTLVVNEYLYQLLKFNENELMKLRVGSGLPNIQKKDLVSFVLNFTQ
jgi:type I restriction enzyme S subunit